MTRPKPLPSAAALAKRRNPTPGLQNRRSGGLSAGGNQPDSLEERGLPAPGDASLQEEELHPHSASSQDGLSGPFLDRLAKVLGMLGSAHDGEIIAAGRRAHMMVTSAGWTWPELLGAPSAVQNCRQARQMVEACLAAGDLFDDYETKFLKNILPQLKRGRRISDKQFAWLGRLHDCAMAARGEAKP
jgi:hypothetical protein